MTMVPPVQESACANPSSNVTTPMSTTASPGYIDTPYDSHSDSGDISVGDGGAMINENSLHHHVAFSNDNISCSSGSNDNDDDDDEYLLEMEGHVGCNNSSTDLFKQHLKNNRDEASSTPTDDRLRNDMRVRSFFFGGF